MISPIKTIFIIISPALCGIFLLFSCNSNTVNKQVVSGKSGIAKITLPDPVPVTNAEFLRIKNACQLWYDTALKTKNFNGGIIVAKNGNIIFEAYNGTAHLPGNDSITAITSMHIASVSKTFTAMAVLKLWQDDKLNIDDEFNKYFPEFNYPGVTIRDLLCHRSGLPNYTNFLEKLGWDKTKIATNQNVLDFLITRKSEFADITMPGMHFSYCNTNYSLLALLIEKITGKNYSTFLNETFFIPLQMKNTFVYNIIDSNKVVPSYDWKNRIVPFNFLDGIYGDKNIYTTPEDLLIWDRALTSSKLFNSEILAEAYAPYSNEKPGTKNYGLGWRMDIYPTGKKIIFHNGWWHGSNAVFMRLLDESATIILIGNKFNKAIYYARVLANIFGDYYNIEEPEESESLKSIDTTNSIKSKRNAKENMKLQYIFKDKNQKF